MQSIASQILLSAYQVTLAEPRDTYEFILNSDLSVAACMKLQMIARGIARPVDYPKHALEGALFELSHVRIDPKKDNTKIIRLLTKALCQIGVAVTNQPCQTSMSICYKPLGEISHTVRFYLSQEEKLVFLSPLTRPKLVYSKPQA